MKSQRDPGDRRHRPGKVRRDRPSRRWFGRDLHRDAAAGPPLAPVLLHEPYPLVRIEVASKDDRRVARPVPPFEENMRIGELVRHLLDVGEEAHRGVLVRVHLVGVVALHFEQFRKRVGRALVVLPEDGLRLGAEVCLQVFEVHKPVRFDVEDLLKVLLREGDVVVRVIVGGIGVLAGPGARHDRLVPLRPEALRAAEHHVLEEMGEARLPRFHLVPRAGLYRNLERDQVREPRGNDDDAQPIGEGRLCRAERENV